VSRSAIAVGIWIAATAAAFAATRVGVRTVIEGDGIGYFAPLASLLADHDLDLANELQPQVPAPLLRAIYLAPDGRLGNPFSIGPALLWAPAVTLAHARAPAPRSDPDADSRPLAHPAYTPQAAQAVLWTNVVAVAIASAVLVAVLALTVAPWIAALAVVAALFGTPAIAYVSLDPAYSHAASFAAAALVVAAAWYDRKRRRLPLFVLGACTGLLALVRWQDAVLGLVFVPRLADDIRAAGGLRAGWRSLLHFGAPVVSGLLPQLVYWYVLYGRLVIVPPGPDFTLPHILPLLFSTWNGAFVWSPVLLLGLAAAIRHAPRADRTWICIAIGLQIVISSSLLDWWGGRSFGARRLVPLAPVAAAGLALWLESARTSRHRVLVTTAITLALAGGCAWNTTLVRYQRLALLPWNPGNQADYVRHHAQSSPRARRYGLWDYPRLVAEVAEARRLHAIDTRRRRSEARP